MTDSLYWDLYRAADRLAAEFADVLLEEDLSQPLYDALKVIKAAGLPGIPTRQIGQHMLTREPDVSRLIDRLQSGGLVTRERKQADRRVTLIACTLKGKKTLDRLRNPIRRLHRYQFGHLSKSKIDQLERLLNQLNPVAYAQATTH